MRNLVFLMVFSLAGCMTSEEVRGVAGVLGGLGAGFSQTYRPAYYPMVMPVQQHTTICTATYNGGLICN